jgi:hypothetical protein
MIVVSAKATATAITAVTAVAGKAQQIGRQHQRQDHHMPHHEGRQQREVDPIVATARCRPAPA